MENWGDEYLWSEHTSCGDCLSAVLSAGFHSTQALWHGLGKADTGVSASFLLLCKKPPHCGRKSIFSHEGKPGWEVRAGTEARDHGGILLTGWLPVQPTSTTCLGVVLLTVSWLLSHHSLTKKMPQTCLAASLV